jgi:WD40 repeat protein
MKNGIVNFFDASTLKLINKVCQHKNPDKDMISALKFSPDGSKVAIGYSPPHSVVYLYDYTNLSSKPKVCKGCPSRINSIDFSRSGS